jgi:hypothetical protein
MKVLITGCSQDTYWYLNRVGETFDVLSTDLEWRKVLVVGETNRYVNIKDCHVIQSIGTVLMEWEKSGGELELWSSYLKEWVKLIKEDGVKLDDILRIKPVEQPQYRPYTFEEAKEVFTKDAWVIEASSGDYYLVTGIFKDAVEFGQPECDYETLLENYTHLDGIPCGVKIN